MVKEYLANGYIKLTGENNIIDTRTYNEYSVFIGDEREERFFKDAEVRGNSD